MASLESLLQKCTSLASIKQLQAHLLTSGKFQFYPSLTTTLLERCALSPVANLPYPTALFRHLQNPSTNQWNAVVRGLAQSLQPTQAIAWYKTMSQASQKIDALTCSFSLRACARALAFSEAMQIHSQIKVFDEMGQRDIACWNALISGLAQGNRPTEAIALFQRMSEEEGLKPNEVTVLGALSACSQLGSLKRGEKIHAYIMDEKLDMHVIVCNAVIDMYAKCGFEDKAYWVFENMKCGKNLITWNTMIMAFAMHGNGDKALELFGQMDKSEVCPDAVSYLAALCACNHAGLVADGVRAGRIQEAYEIINSMPMFPDVVLWQTLLGASKTYRNGERGHEEKGCEEDTGFWVHEVEGVIHKFVNGDQSHTNWREIYAKLDEILFRIKAYGYAAKTNNVLHDIGEEEKENALSYHCEKLAVAFGLISTNEGTPIQVIKNLRICEDCHVVIKLISKVYNREIIVRDRARFHRFKEGLCSCRDYW
ncbi:hypothetical protein FF1_002671 [Malus domestica]